MKRIRSNKNTRYEACIKLQGGKDMFGNDVGESVITGNDDVQVRFAGITYFRFKLFGGRIEALYYSDDNDVGTITVDGNKLSCESADYDRICQSVYNIVDQQITMMK